MTIVEFLETRISEDEARAVQAQEWVSNGPSPHIPWYGAQGDRAGRVLGGAHSLVSAMSPTRILSECAAKRAIMSEHEPVQRRYSPDSCSACADWEASEVGEGPPSIEWPCPTILALSAIYKDHPDFAQATRG